LRRVDRGGFLPSRPREGLKKRRGGKKKERDRKNSLGRGPSKRHLETGKGEEKAEAGRKNFLLPDLWGKGEETGEKIDYG